MLTVEKNEAVDTEWIELILEAKNLGLTMEEIRELLKTSTIPERFLK
jgi:DNA-binding transcriptional MerR regulator